MLQNGPSKYLFKKKILNNKPRSHHVTQKHSGLPTCTGVSHGKTLNWRAIWPYCIYVVVVLRTESSNKVCCNDKINQNRKSSLSELTSQRIITILNSCNQFIIKNLHWKWGPIRNLSAEKFQTWFKKRFFCSNAKTGYHKLF